MHGGEFLQASHSPETKHCTLSSSEGEVRVFRSVVRVATDLLAVLVADLVHGCAIRWAAVGDNHLRIAVSLHCFLQEFQGGGFVAPFRDIGFQYFAFVINGAPEIMLDAIDFDEDLVEVPLPLCHLAHVVSTRFTDFLCEVSSETIYPETDTFVADINATLVE